MLTRLGKWINERWPLSNLVKLGLEEEIIGGSSYAYIFGSLLLFTFAMQAATGVWQLFYYVPTVQHAYASVNYLRTEVPFGWLIHGLHYWGANAMIILLLCHAIRVFIYAAYKSPRELTWLAGVGLLFITLAMSFTGAPLPWDERGYWATEVGTSIAGTVPFIGNLIKHLLRGGESMGQLALSRMFVLHIAIIPGTLLAMLGIHLVAFRRNGSVGPWDEAKRARRGQFWPDQLFKDTLACTILFIILLALVVFVPPPFAGPADPLDTLYVPKPEWNFLFLYEILKFFPGKLEAVGTVGVPALGVLVLVLLPFYDRNKERAPRHRIVALSFGALSIVGLIVLTIAGYYSKPGAEQKQATASPVASAPQAQDIATGKALFQSQGCASCHKIDGSGGSIGPDLSGEGTKGRSVEWIKAQLRSPETHNPQSIMPAFSALSTQQINQLTEYLMSLKSDSAPAGGGASSGTTAAASSAATQVQDVAIGKTLFQSQGCLDCHRVNGSGGNIGPDLSGEGLKGRSIEWLQTQLRSPKAHNPQSIMPAFSALSAQQINQLIAYIMSLKSESVPAGGGTSSGAAPAEAAAAANGADRVPGKAAFIIGSAEHGAVLFEKNCASCHGPRGTGLASDSGSTTLAAPALNPIDRRLYNKSPQLFATNIDLIIQHGPRSTGSYPVLSMHAFGDLRSQTQEEIADLEAYILDLNGVNRGEILHPGLRPQTFLFGVIGIFALIMVALLGVYFRRKNSGLGKENS